MGQIKSPIQLAITTGDKEGIGLEVTLKALKKVSLNSRTHLSVYLSKKIPSFLKPTYVAIKNKFQSRLTFEFRESSPALWIEEVAHKCMQNEYHAMVTAPLSKTEINRSGLQDMGHTGILSRVTGRRDLHMAFLGTNFHTLLATGHIPLSEVTELLTESALRSAILHSEKLRLLLSKKEQKRPLALLGLNPHAGECGLIGNEEIQLFPKILKWASQNKISLVGPLAPDSAFQQTNWQKYSVFISCYHDQGLIPFKTVHEHDGVHVTMGLPFIRTSVDHGTGKDIYKKNIANSNSMLSAIEFAEKLAIGEK